MKAMRISLAALALVLFVGCGGGGGNTPSADAQAQMTAAYKGFGTLFSDTAVAQCVTADGTCNCPGGGTVTSRSGTFTFASCKATDGLSFTGTLTVTGTGATATLGGDLSLFGECTNASASDIPTNSSCGGQIVATCSAQSTTGWIVQDTAAGSGCTLDFNSTLSKERVQQLYDMTVHNTFVLNAFVGFLSSINGKCESATNVEVAASASGACDNGGTFSTSGTVVCHKATSGALSIYTLTSVSGAALTGDACALPVSISGQSHVYNVALTGTASQFSMGDGMTVTIDNGAATQNPTLTGTSIVGFNPIQLGGDVTASAAYTSSYTFTNWPIHSPPTAAPACTAGEIFTATESGRSGTCTITSDCNCQ